MAEAKLSEQAVQQAQQRERGRDAHCEKNHGDTYESDRDGGRLGNPSGVPEQQND
jgi:hypothetical protein